MAGLQFVTAPESAAGDPNRMDIAMFIGFAPLAGSSPPNKLLKALEAAGWGDRVAADGLRDVPVRVRSWSAFTRLFDPMRPDRIVRVAGRGIRPEVSIDAETDIFVVELDGEILQVPLPAGPAQVADLAILIDEGLGAAAEASTMPVGDLGDVALAITRLDDGADGSMTVFANAALGFPVAARGSTRRVSHPLGLAVQSYFASGGKECVVVRLDDPAPLIATEAERTAKVRRLLNDVALIPETIADLGATSFPPIPPAAEPLENWSGLTHLHALEDVTHVLTPDLPELLANRTLAEVEAEGRERPPELFAVCADEAPATFDTGVQAMAPPVSNNDGYRAWAVAARWIEAQIRRVSGELIALLALPAPAEDVVGGAEEMARAILGGDMGPALNSNRVQVVYPWIRSDLARLAPGGAMPADGMVAGVIADVTLDRGAWRSIAGIPAPRASGLSPALRGLDPDGETWRWVTLLEQGPEGPRLLSDRSFSADPAFQQAGIRRLIAMILRAARRQGEATVFESSGPRLWSEVEYGLEAILRGAFQGGAFRGVTEEEAYDVVCDRSTMSQADIDNGRLIARVGVAPAQSIETIILSLAADRGAPLAEAGGGA